MFSAFLNVYLDFKKFSSSVEISRDRVELVGVQLRVAAVLGVLGLAWYALQLCRKQAWPIRMRTFASSLQSPYDAVRRFASHRRYGCGVIVASALLGCLAIATIARPLPFIHDEVANLFQGETFALGRLTNPAHRHWRHFEGFHIIQQPTAQSKYPPGQGMVLAFGLKVFGQAIAGVWLSVALACLAVYWLLAAFLPASLAFWGGILAATCMVFSNMGDGYMGGALAIGGSALVVGSATRLKVRPCWRNSVWLGMGVSLLALSRPYEGAILTAVTAAFLLPRLIIAIRQGHWRQGLTMALPALLVTGGTLAFIAYYNAAVTGDPWLLPYKVHDDRYLQDPVLLFWKQNLVPSHDNAVIYLFHKWASDNVLRVSWQLESLRNFAIASAAKLLTVWRFYVGVSLTPLLLVGLIATWRRRESRYVPVALGFLCAGLLCISFVIPQYGAPAAPLLFLAIMIGLRAMLDWRPRGRAMGRALAPIMFGLALVSIPIMRILEMQPDAKNQRALVRRQVDTVMPKLEAAPGKHLVLVNVLQNSLMTYMWLQNSPDLDRSKIVWAWDLGSEKNRDLIEYFRDRQLWRLDLLHHFNAAEKKIDNSVTLSRLHRID